MLMNNVEKLEHDVNAYKRVEFFYIYTLFIIYWIKNLDIYKLSIFIWFLLYTIIYYSIKNKIINIYI
jgi:hypothetical protein